MDFLSKFYAEKKQWFKYIYKRLNFGVKNRYVGSEEAAEDIFDESLLVLQEKYVALGKVRDADHAKALLINIIRIEVFKYLNRAMDARWARFHPEEVESGGLPPSVRLSREYSRKYHQEHKEARRIYYKQWSAVNSDNLKKNRKAWIMKNREKVRARQKIYDQRYQQKKKLSGKS